MGLLEQAKTDIKNITGNLNDFGASITFTTPDGGASCTVVGYHAKHWTTVSDEGEIIDGKEAHVAISEDRFNAAGYTVRNANNEVDLLNHRVTVNDSSGVAKQYIVRQQFPDETVGLIVMILGDYE